MALTPPWPPDIPAGDDPVSATNFEAVESCSSTPADALPPNTVVEETSEPARKRGRRKKIYKDFVETPDLDEIDDPKSTPDSSSFDSERLEIGDQRVWHCSQCGQVYHNCIDFARHLRDHYHPRKLGDKRKTRHCGARVRPKKFDCQFCEAKFSSSKLLQRHRLRLHRRQMRGAKAGATSSDANDDNNAEKHLGLEAQNAGGTNGQISWHEDEARAQKPCHISDTDAATILLEIEANCDKPEEHLDNLGDLTLKSMPLIVVSENGEQISAQSLSSAHAIIEMPEIENATTDEITAAVEMCEDSSLSNMVAEGTMPEEVVENAPDDSVGEMMALLTGLLPETKPSATYCCDICNKSFDKSEFLFRHIRMHTGEYSCTQCCKVFARKETLVKHACSGAASVNSAGAESTEEDESGDEHFCPFCQKSFAKKQLLRRHITKHTGEFTCNACGKSYCSKDILKNHVCCKNPEEGNHSCEICHKTFSKAKYLEKHIPVHTGAHTCPNCGKWLRSNDSLINHLRICWQVKELEMNGLATCPHCKQEFSDSRAFRRHMYEHTHLFSCPNCGARFRNKVSELHHLCDAQRTVECETCSKQFPNVASLNKHKACHGEAKLKCKTCGVTFNQKDDLSSHNCQGKAKKKGEKRRAQPSLQPLVCELCGSLFSSTSSLNVHKRLHGEKQFSCEVCGKRFHRKDLMLDHCAVHGEPAVPCPMCNKMFKTKKSLDVHLLIHDGVKRFACTTCGKQFYQKGNLLKHEEVHNPDRKYGCTFCAKTFSTKEYLAIHVLEHTRGRIYACDVCDKSFVKEHQLKAHQRVFHTNLAYVCSFCGLNVKLKHSLKRHLNKKHPDQRSLWNDSAQIAAMLVPHAQMDEDENEQIENVELVENLNQVQDGTEVLLAVAGIGSEALQHAIASGTARIQQGSTPNTIEISLPVENDVDDAFASGTMEGGSQPMQTRIIRLPLTNEMGERGTEERADGERDTIDERLSLAVHPTADDMEAQITILEADDQFQTSSLTENSTIVLENGTILQQGMSEDGTDILFYVLTTEEQNGNDS